MKNNLLEAEEKRLCREYGCSNIGGVIIKLKKLLRDAKNG